MPTPIHLYKPDNKAIGLDFLKLVFVFFLISALADWQVFGISFFVLLGIAALLAFVMMHRRVNSITIDTREEKITLDYFRIIGSKRIQLPFRGTTVSYVEERDGKGALRYFLKVLHQEEEKAVIIPMLNGWTEKVLEDIAEDYAVIVERGRQTV